MNERDWEFLKAEFDRIDREVVTADQATAHLQSLGMLDENGELAPQYRSVTCQ